MKQTVLLLLVLCLVLQLSGCKFLPEPTGSTQQTTTTPTPGADPTEISSEPVDPAPSAPPSAPLVSLALPAVTHSTTAADGTVIFDFTSQNISLIAPDADVAQNIILDFLNRVDAASGTADSVLNRAKSAYQGQENWTPYLCTLSYRPVRIDSGVLSLFGTLSSYYGSPHPETVYSALNYDLITGEPMTLGDILPDTATIQDLLDKTLTVLKKNEKTLYLYEGYEDTVRSHFSGSSLQNAWYFSTAGLCFYFAPYEIAPYASGVVIAEIPYTDLAGIINDSYFPAELEAPRGEIAVSPFSAAAVETLTRFSEVVLTPQSEKLLLTTDYMVQNIRIESGFWSATGALYTPQHTVFASSALTATDGIMVEADLKTAALRLSYDTDSGTQIFFIEKTADSTFILRSK